MLTKIGVMGDRGSFSEMAGESYAQQAQITDVEILPLTSAETVLSELENETIDKGIFPIENSNGGIVLEAVEAMAKYQFRIEKMFEVDIHHNILVLPGTPASRVTTITSHGQALKQCRMYLQREWPGVDIREYKDTAAAAHDLREGVLSGTTAVIAPRRSAELYDLEILEESIQDLKFNFTTFVVATKFE